MAQSVGHKASNGKMAQQKSAKAKRAARGVDLSRHYTQPGVDPLDEVTYERRSSVITNPDGSVVFKMEGAEIPATWSQLATDIVVSKYFRKAGIQGKKEEGKVAPCHGWPGYATSRGISWAHSDCRVPKGSA